MSKENSITAPSIDRKNQPQPIWVNVDVTSEDVKIIGKMSHECTNKCAKGCGKGCATG